MSDKERIIELENKLNALENRFNELVSIVHGINDFCKDVNYNIKDVTDSIRDVARVVESHLAMHKNATEQIIDIVASASNKGNTEED